MNFSDVSVLPTPAFFYGLRLGEEINIAIEEGKSLIVRLVNISEPDKDGRRTITYELNGITREHTYRRQEGCAANQVPSEGGHHRSIADRRAHSRIDRQHRGSRSARKLPRETRF